MLKRERLERAIAGEAVDRVPVALWRCWPGDDQRAADLARCAIDFQRQYDWDFVCLCPAPHYALLDHGLQDEWEGAPDGSRAVRRTPIRRSLDWTELRPLDPSGGELGRQMIGLRLVLDAMRTDAVPVVIVVPSPLSQAAYLAGLPALVRALRRQPDRLRTGLNVLSESTLRWVEALATTDLAGIVYNVELAHHDVLSEAEYADFGLADDRRILETAPSSWWLNILSLTGESPMFGFVAQLPAPVVNWPDRVARPDMLEARALFAGAACGGLDAEHHLRQATPSVIRDLARELIFQMGGRRLILGAGGPVAATTPLSNLRALREIVDAVGSG